MQSTCQHVLGWFFSAIYWPWQEGQQLRPRHQPRHQPRLQTSCERRGIY